MIETQPTPKIDEMIAFLARQNPARLNALQQQNPAYAPILREGEVLGPSQSTEELAIRAKVCFAATEEAIKLCNEQLPKLKATLRGSQSLQLWGQILTTISSAAVISSLAADYTYITYISGGLSLAGGLVPLIVEKRNTGLHNSTKREEAFGELIQLKLEAESNQRELRFFLDHQFNVEGISQVISRCNVLCLRIGELFLAT